ncbi:MAG: arginine repressor [Eubacteriales bacterium]|nr:arginine repressor [Eubacteriales bacterium]
MKRERREEIVNLITKHRIATQEELVERLNQSGHCVTQATVSRDIREMKITKVTDDRGGSHYVMPPGNRENLSEKYLVMLTNGIKRYEVAGNLLVIRTISGTAMSIATAIDAFAWPEVVGCIAGDDTVFVATGNQEAAEQLTVRLRKHHLGE